MYNFPALFPSGARRWRGISIGARPAETRLEYGQRAGVSPADHLSDAEPVGRGKTPPSKQGGPFQTIMFHQLIFVGRSV